MSHIRKLLPKLGFNLRKGSCGKIAIIGGSIEYTGAPAFAAFSALNLGADIVHIFCSPEAAPVIKGYSPDFIVHPRSDNIDELIEKLERCDAIVIGPGLGRSDDGIDKQKLVREVLLHGKKNDLPVVVDGDALWFLNSELDLYKHMSHMILTPNIVEFSRLAEAAINKKGVLDIKDQNEVLELAKQVSRSLGISIFLKGKKDSVINPDGTFASLDEAGSPRRCGGQGDTTAGTLAVFLLWALRKEHNTSKAKISAGLASSQLVKRAAKEAYKNRGRSMVTSDIIDSIPHVLKLSENYIKTVVVENYKSIILGVVVVWLLMR